MLYYDVLVWYVVIGSNVPSRWIDSIRQKVLEKKLSSQGKTDRVGVIVLDSESKFKVALRGHVGQVVDVVLGVCVGSVEGPEAAVQLLRCWFYA